MVRGRFAKPRLPVKWVEGSNPSPSARKEIDMERYMYIPTVGDEITLAADWTFSLYNEYRNEGMIKFTFPGAEFDWKLTKLPSGEVSQYGSKMAEVVLPKGAVLKIDRIYIRKGAKDYDSVTFILQSIPKKDIEVPEERSIYDKNAPNPSRKDGERGAYVKKTVIRNKIRFWAKLKDINNIQFLMGRKEYADEKPAVGRLIRVGGQDE